MTACNVSLVREARLVIVAVREVDICAPDVVFVVDDDDVVICAPDVAVVVVVVVVDAICCAASLRCISICRVMWSRLLNLFSHLSHSYGRSAKCACK